jgi:hypothetical protein
MIRIIGWLVFWIVLFLILAATLKGLGTLLFFVVLIAYVPFWIVGWNRRRRWARQEASWQSGNASPPMLIRKYRTDKAFERDAARLLPLGYVIQSQSKTHSGAAAATRVVYVTKNS